MPRLQTYLGHPFAAENCNEDQWCRETVCFNDEWKLIEVNRHDQRSFYLEVEDSRDGKHRSLVFYLEKTPEGWRISLFNSADDERKTPIFQWKGTELPVNIQNNAFQALRVVNNHYQSHFE